jgi:hypothetical protein
MTDSRDASTSRSGLSPGAWAAVSAVAVALIGAGVTLTTAWWSSHREASPAVASTPSSVPPPASETAAGTAAASPPAVEARADPGLAGLVGHWSGKAELAGQPAQRIEVEITAGCARNAACGWIAVPDVPCRGQITLVGPDPAGFEFRVDRFDASSDAQRCQPGGGEVLRPVGDGAMAYTATYSGARGVLRPVP